MDIYGYVIAGAFVISLIAGLAMGLGKVIKFFTKGVFGWIIAVVVCAEFGGIIANIPFVADLIAKGNEYFAGIAAFLGKIHLASILYYVILFVIVTIIKIILAKVLSDTFGTKTGDSVGTKVWNFISRLLGMVISGAFMLFLIFFALAIVELFADLQSVSDYMTAAETGDGFNLVYKLYTHNPIDLTAVFASAKETVETAKEGITEMQTLVTIM